MPGQFSEGVSASERNTWETVTQMFGRVDMRLYFIRGAFVLAIFLIRAGAQTP